PGIRQRLVHCSGPGFHVACLCEKEPLSLNPLSRRSLPSHLAAARVPRPEPRTTAAPWQRPDIGDAVNLLLMELCFSNKVTGALMKLPVAPPAYGDLFDKSDIRKILSRRPGPEVKGSYEHWDQLRHLTPPEGLTSEEWWLGIKMARRALRQEMSLKDKTGTPFTVVLSDSIQRKLFLIGRDAAGALRGQDSVQPEVTREHYLLRSLMEEAMTSSQLEGAATTTQVAKDMLRSGRQPRDYGERMIYNNYIAMRELKRWRQQPLTPAAIFEVHRKLTDGTLEDQGCAGRFRLPSEDIVIEDETGRVLHVPPHAKELEQRLQSLCDFANQSDDGEHFVHPVIRAILIHFQIGYDHPFVDGNGRTARTLFYWSLLRSG